MPANKGFTLLEVLIAMTLFGLMMALLFGTLVVANRSWETGAKRADQVADRVVLERFLRQVLGQARVWPGSIQEPPFGLLGTAQELSFIAYLSHSPGARGLQRFTLYLSPRSFGGQDLRVRIAKADGSIPPGEEEARDQVLLEDVSAVRFAYWEEGDGETGGWKERWEGTVLPRAVWIEVKRRGEEWPPYVVFLPIQMATARIGIRPDAVEP